MRTSAGLLGASICALWLAIGACGRSSDRFTAPTETPVPRTPLPAPDVELTTEDRQVWAKLPPDRSAIPVLLYHGIGPESDFSNAVDAGVGVDTDDFAKQMTMIRHAGYRTIDLQTLTDFVQERPVDLPPRPLLLTFDDARANSWTGGDGILRELGFSAVMFVDAGRVDGGDPEYLTWDELQTVQDSGRWELQLHSGDGHRQIRYGPGEDDYGPYYAYVQQGEDFDAWQERVRSDIEWGRQTLADHVSGYQPLAFAPPYGNYGQEGSNDARIADDLLGWLTQRYELIFTQDVNARARPGQGQPVGRIQLSRHTTGGDLYDVLLSGGQ
jgi:peptidoglycan/xylan/chitin deacetylase (PgdA/CDA1 family)